MLRLAKRDQAAMVALMNASDLAAAVALFHGQQAIEKAMKAVI